MQRFTKHQCQFFIFFFQDNRYNTNSASNNRSQNDAMKNVWNLGNPENEKREKNPSKEDPFHNFKKSTRDRDIFQVWQL